MPLADITNHKVMQANKLHMCSVDSPDMSRRSCESAGMSPEAYSPLSMASPMAVQRYAHDPYGWKCLPDESQIPMIMAQRAVLEQQKLTRRQPTVTVAPEQFVEKEVSVSPTTTACRTLVQFKCHQTEFASPIIVDKGQYVVVQGDRGIDIGVVIRVNTDSSKSYVERTGPNGSVIRHATQREVDYWATDLKADEATALEYCQERVTKMRLPMEVKHAEYQFDKKKLTFYYDAKARVDFVQLLKELYREFGCRIWMEKVRMHE